MSKHFPEPKSLGKMKVELNLSNHATKIDLKNAKKSIHHFLVIRLI